MKVFVSHSNTIEISDEQARRIAFEYIRERCGLPEDCEVVCGEVKETKDTGRGSDLVFGRGLATREQIIGDSLIKQLQNL